LSAVTLPPRHPVALPRWLGVLLLLFGLGLLLLAVVAVGHFTRGQIRDWDRYAIGFTEIDCTTPPGQDRAEFLAEVQNAAGLPDRLQLLDNKLAARLADAFAGHPCVEKVEQVVILPSRQVQVYLSFRVPVLEVMLPAKSPREPPSGELSWVVDQQGNLLPKKHFGEPLPLFFATAPPAGPAGRPWGDATVEAAARTAGFLQPHQERLRLKVFEIAAGNLVLCTVAGTRVLWGQAPGAEQNGEASAEQKLERLLRYCHDRGSLDQPAGRYEHDVRFPNGAAHRSLPIERP
jgi:hypothetical protein